MDSIQQWPPELDKCMLKSQLIVFAAAHHYKSHQEAIGAYQSLSPEGRQMLKQVRPSHVFATAYVLLSSPKTLYFQVGCLLRLMSLHPVGTCSSERSFSSLRRLKTWLRSTMSQKRLNSVAICHVHRDKMDVLDVRKIAINFIRKHESRLCTFGSFWFCSCWSTV
jgi:hypothetical protein